MTPRQTLGAAAAVGRWALRAYATSSVLIGVAAAVAIATIFPVLALGGSRPARLHVAPIADAGLDILRSGSIVTPALLQQRAVATLSGVLVGLAVAALVIAVTTILSLAAARSSEREREVIVRRAVGAGRWSLRAGGLMEGAILAAAAVSVGLPTGMAGARWAAASWPGAVSAGSPVAPLGLVLGCCAAVLIGVMFPVIWLPRLRRRTTRIALPHGLAVPALQLGVGLAVLVVAGQLTRHAGRLLQRRATPAAESGEVIALASGARAAVRGASFASLVKGLEDSGRFGVVSLSSPGALAGFGTVDVVITDCGRCSQGGIQTPLRPVAAAVSVVSRDTFRAMGVPVLRGRGIVSGDDWRAPRVAVVNRTLATRHFEGGVAVGRKIKVGEDPSGGWYTVVGVVDNARREGFGAAGAPPYAVYLSALQVPPRAAELLLRPVRAGPMTVPPDLAPGPVLRESAWVQAQAAPIRWFAGLVRLTGWSALAIAALGVFAVMQLWVTALAPELGVRRAVGARRRQVVGYVLARAIGIGIAGLVIGLWASEMASAGLGGLLPGLPDWEFGLALKGGVALVAAALAGTVYPAWRASRADPAGMIATLEG